MNELLNDRYKVVKEIKPARDCRIYWLVTDQKEGKFKTVSLYERLSYNNLLSISQFQKARRKC